MDNYNKGLIVKPNEKHYYAPKTISWLTLKLTDCYIVHATFWQIHSN